MVYRYEISPRGEYCFRQCLDYLLYEIGGTGNIQAAKHFIKEFEKALHQIELGAKSYAICEEKWLRALEIRKIHFAKMSYKIFFHLKENNTVIIDAICHDLQDFENIF